MPLAICGPATSHQRIFSGGDDTVMTGQFDPAVELLEQNRSLGLNTGLSIATGSSNRHLVEFRQQFFFHDKRPTHHSSRASGRAGPSRRRMGGHRSSCTWWRSCCHRSRALVLQTLGMRKAVPGGISRRSEAALHLSTSAHEVQATETKLCTVSPLEPYTPP